MHLTCMDGIFGKHRAIPGPPKVSPSRNDILVDTSGTDTTTGIPGNDTITVQAVAAENESEPPPERRP